MVLQTLGKWSQIKGMSSPAAAGGDEEIALQTVKFLPYPVRLSSEAHLWADQRAETSTKEDIQRVQINPSAAPATPRTSIPTLISMNSLTSSYASIPTQVFLPSASSILPPTRPPLHCCCFHQNPIKPCWRFHSPQLPLISPDSTSAARALPGGTQRSKLFSQCRPRLFIFPLKSYIYFVFMKFTGPWVLK